MGEVWTCSLVHMPRTSYARGHTHWPIEDERVKLLQVASNCCSKLAHQLRKARSCSHSSQVPRGEDRAERSCPWGLGQVAMWLVSTSSGRAVGPDGEDPELSSWEVVGPWGDLSPRGYLSMGTYHHYCKSLW